MSEIEAADRLAQQLTTRLTKGDAAEELFAQIRIHADEIVKLATDLGPSLPESAKQAIGGLLTRLSTAEKSGSAWIAQIGSNELLLQSLRQRVRRAYGLAQHSGQEVSGLWHLRFPV